MLTIRAEQFQALAQSVFETWMWEHLTEFFPEQIAGLNSSEVHDRIRAAVTLARRWGFVSDSQLCRYVDLTFILGPDFHEDPMLPWASDILADQRLIKDPEMRMEILYSAAQDHVERIEQAEAGE